MLQQILFSVPDRAVPAVQRAIVQVAEGEWRKACTAMFDAADDCLSVGDEAACAACDSAARELFKKA